MVYYSQAITVLLFGGVVAFLITQNQQGAVGDNTSWMYIVTIVLISSVAMAYFIFRLLLGKIKQPMRIQDKMPRYSKALLVRSALLELPGLLAAVAAFITANLHFLSVTLLVVLMFIFLRPTKNTIANDLSLSTKERALLDNDGAVISEVEG
jgi:hypothetical protein